MIVRLKKVTVVCLESDREPTLERLRQFAGLHVVPLDRTADASVDEAEQALAASRQALLVLDRLAQEMPGAPPPGEGPSDPADILSIEKQRNDAAEQLRELEREEKALEPLGSFDPARIRSLTDNGISVRFYRAPRDSMPAAPPGTVLTPLGVSANDRYFALSGRGNVACEATEIPLPRASLVDIRREREAMSEKVSRLRDTLYRATASRPALARRAARQADALAFSRARAGMARHGPVTFLQGYVPTDQMDRLRELARQYGWGLHATDPADTDNVPTLLRMPAWVRPIESLFQLIKILPGYREADVSASFLIFLSIFFAMIIGDAGYGLVFLGLTGLVRWKMPEAQPGPFRLMAIFSVCTIIWGLLSGACFGVTDLPAPLRAFRVDWLTDNQNIMHLCLFLGAIHLSVAHLWNMFRSLNSTLAIAQLGWTTVTWTMFFGARAMLLGKPFPGWYVPVAILGFVAVVLFMTPLRRMKTEWINHVMLPLTLMSNFGDILSYLRLFALSVAGLQLAGAFNSMALSMGFTSPVRGLVAALIIFFGHSLNVALGAVSVLVHGVRLNALEFSMHFGLEWAGTPFEPFARRAAEPESNPSQTTAV